MLHLTAPMYSYGQKLREKAWKHEKIMKKIKKNFTIFSGHPSKYLLGSMLLNFGSLSDPYEIWLKIVIVTFRKKVH